MKNALPIFLVLSALALAGCYSGSGEGLDENGRPPGEGGPPPPPPFPATWRDIQDVVYDGLPLCTACHYGASPPMGLDLEEDVSYDMLVGIDSNEEPSVERVAPFDPDNSYLIMKLEGAGSFAQMPLDGPYLDQAEIDVVRQWITDGALSLAITTDPSDQTVNAGQPATFSVTATGFGASALTYQWQEWITSSWQDIVAETGTSFAISSTGLGDDGRQFRCVVTNPNVTPSQSITSSAATLTVQ